MKMDLDVDLIITTRNRKHELLKTLNIGITRLGLSQEQIYIIDDASVDGTFDSVRKIYPNIFIRRNSTAEGLIANRNFLMSITKRKFIFSLDDDSHVRSRSELVEALQLLSSQDRFGCFTFRPFEQLEEPPLKHELKSKVVHVRAFIGCGHIIKREVYNKVGPYFEPFEFYGEELDFCIRALKKGYSTILKSDLVVHHRIDWKKRQQDLYSQKNKGVYGITWRSKMGFSNHLYIDYINFPRPLNYMLLFVHILKRFISFYIFKGDKRGFTAGLRRFRTLTKQKDSRARLSLIESFQFLIKTNY